MPLTRSIFSLCILFFITMATHAQQKTLPMAVFDDTALLIHAGENDYFFSRRNDTIWKYTPFCKILKVSAYVTERNNKNSFFKPVTNPGKGAIVVHGNLSYDFLSRSFSDTPYYQKDFRQHTIQSAMNITVKENFSFRFNMVVRLSNSPWFRNFFAGGLQFDPNTYLNKMKQSAEGRIMTRALQKPELQITEALLTQELEKYNRLQNSLQNPGLAQALIEEREKRYFKQLRPELMIKSNKMDSLISKEKIDTVADRIAGYIAARKNELDSLSNSISKLQGKADSLKNAAYKEAALIKQKIQKAANARELKRIMLENSLSDEKVNKWEKAFADIRSIGIGRSMVNYSELTVNNVSVTGINIEYNPGIYAAVAAGKIDYGFRDFAGQNKSANKQNLLVGRIGLGDKDRRAVILSVFTGRKYNYGSILNDTVNGYINITGYSVEGILRKNANTGVSIEVAKSTRPLSGSLGSNKETGSLFRFSDQSNQAISIKGQTIIQKTGTRLNGFFRKSGENFQSFSLFTYNTDQTAWYLKADQSFFKNRIHLAAMLRRNDFTNPFTEKTFKTSTVFTSAQLSVRIPRWPSVSIGYHPGSQLYIIDRERIRENVYYIVNGSIVHTYALAGIRMMSAGIYNYYSNKSTDSGFVNYSGTNYMISHSLLFRKLHLEEGFIYTDQQELRFYTLEANTEFFPVSFFSIGAGGKYNRTQYGKTYWGGKAQLMLEIKKLGRLQLQYEKSFLPTIYQTLFPVEVGRISWFKYF